MPNAGKFFQLALNWDDMFVRGTRVQNIPLEVQKNWCVMVVRNVTSPIRFNYDAAGGSTSFTNVNASLSVGGIQVQLNEGAILPLGDVGSVQFQLSGYDGAFNSVSQAPAVHGITILYFFTSDTPAQWIRARLPNPSPNWDYSLVYDPAITYTPAAPYDAYPTFPSGGGTQTLAGCQGPLFRIWEIFSIEFHASFAQAATFYYDTGGTTRAITLVIPDTQTATGLNKNAIWRRLIGSSRVGTSGPLVNDTIDVFPNPISCFYTVGQESTFKYQPYLLVPGNGNSTTGKFNDFYFRLTGRVEDYFSVTNPSA